MKKQQYKEMVSELIEEKIILKQQLHDTKQENLRLKFGAPTDGLEVGNPEDYGDEPWIYESPDGGKTIYQRRRGDYDTPRELVEDVKQLELFND